MRRGQRNRGNLPHFPLIKSRCYLSLAARLSASSPSVVWLYLQKQCKGGGDDHDYTRGWCVSTRGCTSTDANWIALVVARWRCVGARGQRVSSVSVARGHHASTMSARCQHHVRTAPAPRQHRVSTASAPCQHHASTAPAGRHGTSTVARTTRCRGPRCSWPACGTRAQEARAIS